jgi:predicted  nucleic acid-binding Zn-ribbon protein
VELIRANTKVHLVRLVCITAICALALAGPGALSGRAQTASDRNEARDSVAGLEDELAVALDRYESITQRITSIQSAMAENEQEIELLARRMLKREAMAINVATELYKGSGSVALEGILSSTSLADVNTRLKYLESSGQINAEVFEKLASEHETLERRLDDLDKARAAAMKAEDKLQELKDDITSRLEGQRSKFASINESLRRRARLAARAPVVSTTSVPVIPDSSRNGRQADWIAIAQCESGLRWHLDSTYDGGLQFHPMTWLGYGGGTYARYAWQASPAEQIAIGERVLDDQGPGAWPNCFRWK